MFSLYLNPLILGLRSAKWGKTLFKGLHKIVPNLILYGFPVDDSPVLTHLQFFNV